MKIGILTFHWAYNYGAVLQAYALLAHLTKQGFEAEIIDYHPDWSQDIQPYSRPRTPGILLDNMERFLRRRLYRQFRREHLPVSSRRYRRGDVISGYDIIIVGSDQVFNPDIIVYKGELDDTYLLANVAPGTRKMAYAASFGNSTLAPTYAARYRELLSDFECISIREESGANIVRNLGLSATTAPDPTLLLGDFSALATWPRHEDDYLLSILFQNNAAADQVIHSACRLSGYAERTFVNIKQMVRGKRGLHHLPPGEWMRCISQSQFVVTDSFHATVFSILTHRPFIALALDAWGGDWSERIKALLRRLGLEQRLLLQPNHDQVEALFRTPISWDAVETHIAHWRKEGADFLESCLKPNTGPSII